MSSPNNDSHIVLNSGATFSFLDPESSEFTIEDIAHGLSHINRFVGHTYEAYNVAQHSVFVSSLVPMSMRLPALLHDAAEAFLGDVSKPLKQLLPEYKSLEKRVSRVISARFSHEVHLSQHEIERSIRLADLTALATERRDLMPNTPDQWECLKGIEPDSETIHPWTPGHSKRVFLATYKMLTAHRDII